MKLNEYNLNLGGGSLLQVANRTLTQMMSYIIETPEGGCIVIDGGNPLPEVAEHLYEELSKRGKRVDLWFITHAHSDHLGALTLLLEGGEFDVEIGKLVFRFPDEEWLKAKEDWNVNERFLAAIRDAKIPLESPDAGSVYTSGSVSVEVLNIPIDYEDYPQINPTGIILKVSFPRREVLFLGDFDVNAEENYKKYFDTGKLRCDVVQMAHHGQGGVSREFYELIMPKYCLYTAPDWLWENNKYRCQNPETRGKGPFTTLETRRWMEELGALESFHLGEGDWIFR